MQGKKINMRKTAPHEHSGRILFLCLCFEVNHTMYPAVKLLIIAFGIIKFKNPGLKSILLQTWKRLSYMYKKNSIDFRQRGFALNHGHFY